MPHVDMAFREYGDGDKIIIVLHGLLGASQNWQRAAKVLAQKFRVLAVDLRNHGDSLHMLEHSIAAMRDDVKDFFDQHQIREAFLLGHSMGGLVAMEFAFRYPERLAGLIIEDIAPRPSESGSGDILLALADIDLLGVTSRQQVDERLARTINSPVTRQFLLTNLVRRADNSFAWRVNLSALLPFRDELASYEPSSPARYNGEALFLGGGKSAYRIDHEQELIRRHFPNSHIEMIPEAGHWIHFEALENFTSRVTLFIEKGLAGFDGSVH